MRINKFCSICILFVLNFTSLAQQSNIYHYDYLAVYKEALELYNNRAYKFAKETFEKVQKQSQEENLRDYCSWYIAKCALKIGGKGSEKEMIDFVNSFVVSPKIVLAYSDLGNYYFMNNDFKESLRWFQKVESDISYNPTDDFKFQIGYSYFSQGKYFDADRYLSQLINHYIYGDKSNYYLGFMAYQENRYEDANRYFYSIKNSDGIKGVLSYYQAYIKFISENYNTAISTALEKIKTSTDNDEISQLNKIIGESHFKLKNYKEAIKHLSLYVGKWKNTDNYQIGYAYYKENEYKRAITYFNKIIREKNGLFQNAYYHLGECYLKIGDKIKALSAFTKASSINSDKQIQQNAWLNRARLSYEIGDFYQVNLVVLDSFVKKYPNSPYKVEIDKLLTNALFSSKNYDSALKIISNDVFKNKDLYQQLLYSKGLELYQAKKYNKAIQYFQKSTTESINNSYYIKAKYCIGESYYLQGKYDAALLEFRDLQIAVQEVDSPVIKELDYHTGYCYFKSGNFDKALERFNAFVSTSEKSRKKRDALVRIGDCYSIKKQYTKALKSYHTAVDMGYINLDYSIYRINILHKYTSNSEEAEQLLLNFIKTHKTSKYADDAYMAIAEMQSENNKPKEGINTYKTMMLIMPYSNIFPKVLLKQALLYERINKNDKAIDNYKNVVYNFPKTQESIEAVGLAKALYIKTNRLKEYAAWVKKIDFNDRADYNSDTQLFKNSKKKFDTSREPESLESYLRIYPLGLYAEKAHYILANYAEDNNETTSAINHLESIIAHSPNRFSEIALYKLGRLLYNNQDYSKIMTYMKTLIKIAEIPHHKKFAYIKIAEIEYLSNKYLEAETTVKKALDIKDGDYLDDEIKLTLSKIYIQTDRINQASGYLKKLVDCKNSQIAAEAYYQKALYLRMQKAYKESNSVIISFQKNRFNQKRTYGKSLLLLASNYSDLEDYFQASFVLDNILNTYQDFPEIIQKATEEINDLKK